MIRIVSRKIVPVLFVASLLLVVGSFFDVFSASASMKKGMNMSFFSGHCANENNNIANGGSNESGGIMPCCIGARHDNSETVLPDVISGKTSLSSALISTSAIPALSYLKQGVYLSSKSPPLRSDVLSSIMKKE